MRHLPFALITLLIGSLLFAGCGGDNSEPDRNAVRTQGSQPTQNSSSSKQPIAPAAAEPYPVFIKQRFILSCVISAEKAIPAGAERAKVQKVRDLIAEYCACSFNYIARTVPLDKFKRDMIALGREQIPYPDYVTSANQACLIQLKDALQQMKTAGQLI